MSSRRRKQTNKKLNVRLRLKREQIETNLETWRCRQLRRNRKAKKEETTMMLIRQTSGNNNQPQTKGDEEYGDIGGQGVTRENHA